MKEREEIWLMIDNGIGLCGGRSIARFRVVEREDSEGNPEPRLAGPEIIGYPEAIKRALDCLTRMKREGA